MVIVLVIDMINCTNNGTSISSRRFAEALCKRGHVIRVITLGDPAASGHDDETGFDMYYVPELIVPIVSWLAHKQKDVWAKPVRETIQQACTGADVVHIFNPWPLGKATQKIAGQMGVPTLGAFHCQPENITYNIGLGWFKPAVHLVYFLFHLTFYRHFSHIHCPSKFIAVQMRKHGYKQWLHILSNGVHADFKPGAKQDVLKQKPYRILMVGRLSPEKRQDVLIHAALLSRHAKDIQLIFAGCGPWDQKYRQMSRILPRQPIFCFLEKAKLIELMQSCDLYVHASDVEIEGISCLEAIACGLVPVISDSRASATVQFALAPENLFRSGNPEELARRIDFWLENPELIMKAKADYTRFIQDYSLDRSIRQIESVYAKLVNHETRQNLYLNRRLFGVCAGLFYTGLAIPLLSLWSHLALGAKIRGLRNLRSLQGVLTVCNHVHSLDSVLIALATFPRKPVFPTLPANLNTLWPGKMVRLLGGVVLTDKPNDLRAFMEEMEYHLRQGRVVHFFPEGELNPYDTNLRAFKSGAFHLAAKARVPIVPMAISFHPPTGIRRFVRKKPIMTMNIGKPIQPVAIDQKVDAELRRLEARKRIAEMMTSGKVSLHQ
jgi:1,2-diacylglycerol 3-alpha-glucosyltransferase